MRFQPLRGTHAFEKDSYISPDWTPEKLNMVAKARRVIGYGGAFPPYKGLVSKFQGAKGSTRPLHSAVTRTRRCQQLLGAGRGNLGMGLNSASSLGPHPDGQGPPVPGSSPDSMVDERGMLRVVQTR